jgi:hypothetical protein
MWKDKVRRVFDDTPFARRTRRAKQVKAISSWRANGSRGTTPHAVKSARVREVGKQFGCEILVETGTCLGEMIVALLHDFAHIHSIELSPQLAERARDRLANRAHVSIHEGDSATVLPRVMAGLDRRALIWLDAHYSGNVTARGAVDSPVVQELATIAKYSGHVILIDDAQDFVGRGGYPTIDEMSMLSQQYFPDHQFAVRDHIIEILPPR